MQTPLRARRDATWVSRAAAIGAGVLLLLPALAACSNDTAGPETGVDVEDVVEGDDEVLEEPDPGPYDDIYGEDFFESITDYIDTEVVLSATVGEVLSDTALTIAGTEDTTVEPLLIIHAEPVDGLERDIVVQVTGIPYSRLGIAEVEERMGLDLDDEQLAEWEGQPYVEATRIDTSPEFDDEE